MMKNINWLLVGLFTICFLIGWNIRACQEQVVLPIATHEVKAEAEIPDFLVEWRVSKNHTGYNYSSISTAWHHKSQTCFIARSGSRGWIETKKEVCR